jgi:hypothetical protein
VVASASPAPALTFKARKLRPEDPGALYHLTNRGDRRLAGYHLVVTIGPLRQTTTPSLRKPISTWRTVVGYGPRAI